MINNPKVFNQIAFSLAKHYECVYYTNIETGKYFVFADNIHMDRKTEFPLEGEDFFADALKNSVIFIHPDDLELMTVAYQKETVLERLAKSHSYSVSFRSLIAGEVIHMRHVVMMCRDNKHIVFCLENVEAEFREKEEQLKKLANAKLQARTDELTGVKNSTAFKEYVDRIDDAIADEAAKGTNDTAFAIVMCDINDLKQTNDTKGHKTGDEEIQATSRLICDTFQHSPVFRIGGDEFLVILTGKDYDQRDFLISVFKDVLDTNRKIRKGPDVACGLAFFEPDKGDKKFLDVFQRADRFMYEDKKAVKAAGSTEDPAES